MKEHDTLYYGCMALEIIATSGGLLSAGAVRTHQAGYIELSPPTQDLLTTGILLNLTMMLISGYCMHHFADDPALELPASSLA